MLTYALKLLTQSPQAELLAFKGGTCIRKLWLGATGRFSMDLDFTARKALEPSAAILDLMELFNVEFHGITFQIENEWRVTQDGLSFTTQPTYCHAWNDEGAFDLQVSLRELPTLGVSCRVPLDQGYFKFLEFAPPEIVSLDEHEIVAEKIRAAYQRSKVRDLHDLYVYAGRVLDRELVRRLVVIKMWQARDCFDPQTFFTRVGEHDAYDWNDLQRLVRSSARLEPRDIVAQVISGYQFLAQLSNEENDLAADAKAHRQRALKDSLQLSCQRKLDTGSF